MRAEILVNSRWSLIRIFAASLLVNLWISGSALFAQSDIWVTAYYGGWSQGWSNDGILPAQNIDYSAVNHVIHFGLVPNADGTLDSNSNSIRPTNSVELISRAHAAGAKVLICVGGWGSDVLFRSATSDSTLPVFVNNLVAFMKNRGYDGIDIDWEILDVTDMPHFSQFITLLRKTLDRISPKPALTSAVSWLPEAFAALKDDFDQFNLMTYDLSGPWPGWISWHNAPLFSGGLTFPSTLSLVPSAETMLNVFLTAGVPAKKISIGIDFYGYVWSGGTGTTTGGVTQPRQSWILPPQLQSNVPYYTLMQTYYQPQNYRWDTVAQAAYLSIDNPGSQNDKFISYDDEATCQKKVQFARAKGIGGVFIWELGGGELPPSFPSRDRLLQSIKHEVQNPQVIPSIPAGATPPNNLVGTSVAPQLTWTLSPGATLYRLELATDSSFASPVLDLPAVAGNSAQTQNLILRTTYYWRVRASNSLGASGWSATNCFTTIADTTLPASWAYVSATGGSATVTLPASSVLALGTVQLKSGDAIGVFFLNSGSSVCAGYGLWRQGSDLSFTIWGDNPLTPTKDGFAAGDTLQFKVWSRASQQEYLAAATYQNGTMTYFTNGSYTLSSLTGSSVRRESIALAQGENMIATFLMPDDSTFERIMGRIRFNLVAVRDGKGGLFEPDSNINTIGTWDVRRGYKVDMRNADTLVIQGTQLVPEHISIPLTQGWNIAGYPRSTPLSLDSALNGIAQSIVVVKDNAGGVFWPSMGINTLDSIKPAQGYQLYLKQQVTLTYPPNSSPAPAFSLWTSQALQNALFADPKRLGSLEGVNSGSNAILLVQSSSLQDGDEVRAKTASAVVGSAYVTSGRALMTIWGDDPLTTDRVEGATEGEILRLSLRRRGGSIEQSLAIDSLTDALKSIPVIGPFRYFTDAMWIANAEVLSTGIGTEPLPKVLSLAQNFPNPFNPSTTIMYELPENARVHLEVFDVLGRSVAILVDEQQSAGGHQARFMDPGLASGVYVYRLQVESTTSRSGSSILTRKMILLK